MKKKFIFVVLVVTVLSGCASFVKKEHPYKTIALGKVAAEELVSAAKQMNRDKLLSDANLQKVKTVYESARKANDVVIDMFIMSLNLGVDPRTVPDYNKALDSYMKLMQDLLSLSFDLGITKEGGVR
ncbi:MAG: hypothetical protein DDT22_00260 [candidate division WS2 bacterium]|nr:hypothetical protein [Candidatus Lithacetigena glycinireducens]MBT9174600.1 hypothetical protein [Candidatus Lithacetigena glycinireducens]